MLNLTQIINKSAARLTGLYPVVLNATTLLIERCYACGVPILITQGLRTTAEQNALYAQGRTKPGAIVTQAKGGYSYHNYGLAVDFALLLPGGTAVSWDMSRDGDGDATADWQEVVRQAKDLGFEWGGDWTSFKDYPHLQMTFGLSLAELRAGAKPSEAAVSTAQAKFREIKTLGAASFDTFDTATVQVNGVKVAVGFLDQGVTYAPVRALAAALGAQISYDSGSKTVHITQKDAKK